MPERKFDQFDEFALDYREVHSKNVRLSGADSHYFAEMKVKWLADFEKNVPLKRFGKPEEVADLVIFLSSERAAFITGACITIDGGQTKSF